MVVFGNKSAIIKEYVGEIKIVNGDAYIADATWTWKKK